ncbi:hypothetical protein P4544_00910 [Halomonas sp. LY9]
MTRLNVNQWLALVLALLAAAYLAMAWQIPTFPLPRPVDSDLFPKVLGVSLLLLATLLFLKSRAPLLGRMRLIMRPLTGRCYSLPGRVSL